MRERVMAGSTDDGPIPGAVIVIAKTPLPGRVKTRLSPPLTPDQACAVAWACLTDTLVSAARVRSRRHVLLLDGEVGPWVPDGFEVVPQRGIGLAERLAAGFTDVDDTAIVIAMDTPHVDVDVLAAALRALSVDYDSVIGPATDGGYWLLGLRAGISPAAVFAGVPMSVDTTGAAQRERLDALGLSTLTVGELRDVDTVDDVFAIAAQHPHLRLGRLVRSLNEARSGRTS